MIIHYELYGDDEHESIPYEYEVDGDDYSDDVLEYVKDNYGEGAAKAIKDFDVLTEVGEFLQDDPDFLDYLKDRHEGDAYDDYEGGQDDLMDQRRLSAWIDSGGW